jgi:hypothetical protein
MARGATLGELKYSSAFLDYSISFPLTMTSDELRALLVRTLITLILVLGLVMIIQEPGHRILGLLLTGVGIVCLGLILMLGWTAQLRFWELVSNLIRRDRDRRR